MYKSHWNIKQTKKVLPIRIKLLLYYTLIIPNLTYGINGGGFNRTRIKNIEKKQ